MSAAVLERPSARHTAAVTPGPLAAPEAGGRWSPPVRSARPVLVVDDDPTIRRFFAEALADDGYEAAQAEDGAEALRLCGVADPCLVLLDMRMPVVDGWEFARRFRERPGRLPPVVVMTAARDAHAWAREIGADGVLAKPFDLNDLAAVVKRFC